MRRQSTKQLKVFLVGAVMAARNKILRALQVLTFDFVAEASEGQLVVVAALAYDPFKYSCPFEGCHAKRPSTQASLLSHIKAKHGAESPEELIFRACLKSASTDTHFIITHDRYYSPGRSQQAPQPCSAKQTLGAEAFQKRKRKFVSVTDDVAPAASGHAASAAVAQEASGAAVAQEASGRGASAAVAQEASGRGATDAVAQEASGRGAGDAVAQEASGGVGHTSAAESLGRGGGQDMVAVALACLAAGHEVHMEGERLRVVPKPTLD